MKGGGKNNAKLDFNPSLSAKHKEKSRQVYLNATFLFVLCNAPPQAGRDVQRSAAPAQIPDSEGLSAQRKIPVVLHPVHQNPRFHGQKSILLLFIHEMPCFSG